MSEEKCEVETRKIIHWNRGEWEKLTIKDNPDSPTVGFMLVYEHEHGVAIEMFLWTQDARAIAKALIEYADAVDAGEVGA